MIVLIDIEDNQSLIHNNNIKIKYCLNNQAQAFWKNPILLINNFNKIKCKTVIKKIGMLQSNTKVIILIIKV